MKIGDEFIATTPVHDEAFQKLKDLSLEACGQMPITEWVAILAQMAGILTLAEEDALSVDWRNILETNFAMGMVQGIEIGNGS